MRFLAFRLPLALLVVLSVFYEAAFASVLAIDYGSDWIKASLMKPGVPFDVLLNKDSKRKIQSSVGWKKTDRLFGSDAYNIVRSRLSSSLRNSECCLCRPVASPKILSHL
ncbi:hypothetical protein HWV62_2438 [Athelia sp. TMB]|nr:hypothetical protein HWV62_2438 [Athelia sp. TMB]